MNRLVEEHYPWVLRRTRVLVGQRHAAEDLAQEVFARFFAAVRSGKQIEQVTAYLNGVLHNVFSEYVRDRKSRPKPALVADRAADPAADGDLVDRPHHEAILELIQLLPDKHRMIVVGRFLMHMSVTEIAASLKSSERSVSLWQSEAMEMLRRLAADREIELEQAR